MKISLVLLYFFISFAYGQRFVKIFEDQFNDSSLANWDRVVQGGSQTGNNEWEQYTNSSKNSYTTGGQLQIVAIKERYGNYKYTSGKLVSRKDYGPYGFFTIKAKMPYGEGAWPAFWLLPRNARTKYGGWPACGQIDVYQSVQSSKEVYGTIHFGGPGRHHQAPSNNREGNYDIENWHTYSVDWQPDHICWYVDAQIVNGQINKNPIHCAQSSEWFSQDSSGRRFPGNAPFDQKFTMIINVAVGGNWPCGVGPCDYNKMPQTFKMQVDYVQIWEKQFSDEVDEEIEDVEQEEKEEIDYQIDQDEQAQGENKYEESI